MKQQQHNYQRIWNEEITRAMSMFPSLIRPYFSVNKRTTRRLGMANYRTNSIEVSFKIFETHPTSENLIDTIRHEIAHLLAPGDGHGAEWKRQCKLIGCRDEQYAQYEEVKVLHESMTRTFELTCTSCGEVIAHMTRKRRPSDSWMSRHRHAGCGGGIIARRTS